MEPKFEIIFLESAREFLLKIEEKAREKLIYTIDKSKLYNEVIFLSKIKDTMNNELKKYSLDEIKDEFIGKQGSVKRETYEYELKMEILGEMIQRARKERNLTQEELGQLIGVQKSQISRLENHTGNVTLTTVLKVFNALRANIKLQVEMNGDNLVIV